MSPEHDFTRAFRHDLAALCSAGAFVSQPSVWGAFVEWLKGTDPEFTKYDFNDEEHASEMLRSVYRMDRVSMMTLLMDTDFDPGMMEDGDVP